MIPEMRRCYQELLRRLGQKQMVERNYHSVGVAHICGGVVGDETYARWPISNWLNSFLKLGEYKRREGRSAISLREHANAFKKCVSSNPNRFYDFVHEISNMADSIHIHFGIYQNDTFQRSSLKQIPTRLVGLLSTISRKRMNTLIK